MPLVSKLTWITKYWIEFGFGLLTTSLFALIKWIKIKIDVIKKENSAQSDGMRSLLKDRILQSYFTLSQTEEVTEPMLEVINDMYSSYHDLGGNGTITKIVDDINSYKVIK